MADPEMKELRGLAPIDLVRALDAIAMAKGKDRNAYVNEILSAHVRSYLEELNVVSTTLRGNPLLGECTRNRTANSHPVDISQ